MGLFRSKSKSSGSTSRLSSFFHRKHSTVDPPEPLNKTPYTASTTSTATSGSSGACQSVLLSACEDSCYQEDALTASVLTDGYTAETTDSEAEAEDEEEEQQVCAVELDRSMKPAGKSAHSHLNHSSTENGVPQSDGRNSLASFRQLRCSMSYKNRHQTTDTYRESIATRTLSNRESLSLGHRNSDPTSMPAHIQMAVSSRHVPRGSVSEVRMTEVNMAALQTRRAFQQMVLAMEDEDSEFEYESDYDFMHRRSSDTSSVVHLGMDEYRKFQFRLRHLEELCQEQARKQANMDEAIEAEVEARTKKVVEAMEKKIVMYKQAKELECEREIQRRMAEYEEIRVSAQDSSGKLEKLFHPRRSRKQMEQRREQEEKRQREMDQFREFIRSTEMRSTMVSASSSDLRHATSALRGCNDPNIDESLLNASPSEMIEMVCVLRKHVSTQEAHLDQAKKLINTAIAEREEAEATAREAVELTMALDSRLERASHEMVVIRDELRQSGSLSSSDLTARISQCSSYLSRSSTSGMSSTTVNNSMARATSLPVSPASYSNSYTGTPASSCPVSSS